MKKAKILPRTTQSQIGERVTKSRWRVRGLRIFYFFLIFCIFLINTLHEEYPDEFDNILGGWYLVNGKLPYRDFFTHHNPGAYFLAGLITFFTGQSFVWFRILLSLIYFLIAVGPYFFLKRRIKKISLDFYRLFILIWGISSTYFWGHMLLGDSLSGYFLLPAYALLFIKAFSGEKLVFRDLVFIFTFTFLTLLSSLSYSYAVMLINGFALYQYFKEEPKKIFSKKLLLPLVIMVLPYFLFLGYLLTTGSLKDFYFQSIDFNARYYIYNYPKPEGSARVNPVRYAIIIVNNFFNGFHAALIQLRDFNFSFPVNSALILANISLLVYLFIKRRFKLAGFAFLVLAYTVVRSSLLFGERDYQIAVFIMLSLFNASFIFPTLMKESREEKEYLKKIFFTCLFFLMSIYWFYNLLFLYRKFNERAFEKYMGTAPLIYDRPDNAPIINAVTDEDDYVWLGPFEFEELFFVKAQVPSKYQILLPEFARSERIKEEMMADFRNHKPKIIMFRYGVTIRGYAVREYGDFFLDFLDENYLRLIDYKENGFKYKSVAKPNLAVDIETLFFINKENKDEIIQRLLENNLVEKVKVE